MIDLNKYKTFVQKMRLKEEMLTNKMEGLSTEVSLLDQNVKDLTKVQEIFNVVGVLAQAEVKDIIEHLVTDALQFVFGEEYGFVIENQISRNQPESHFYVSKGTQRFSLREELGGGVVDVVSFALRFVCWAIQIDRTEPIMFFDEPLKYVDKERLPLLQHMIKEMTTLLNVQTIMVTHEQGLVDVADTCYLVTQDGSVSSVEKIK